MGRAGKESEEEWAAARPVGRIGAMHALTGRVMSRPEKNIQEMYAWYESRVNDEELHMVFLEQSFLELLSLQEGYHPNSQNLDRYI